MGSDRPKAFLDLGGQPLVLRAARAFEAAPSVEGIVAVVAVLLVTMFLMLYVPVARREEHVVAEKFGAAHEAWRAEVPAVLPRLRRYSKADGAGEAGVFAWGAVRRHREHRTVLGQAVVFVFLAWRSLTL